MGHRAKLISNKATRLFVLVAAIYVDDTDLIHWADSCHTEDDKLVDMVQAVTTDFRKLAQETGCNLKPAMYMY